MSDKGKRYGTEYTTLYKSGNIKFIKYNDAKSAKTPQETMTKGRVYVTINELNKPKSITYYDMQNRRRKQIDLDKAHRGVIPHTHHGYEHSEWDSTKKFSQTTSKEARMVERVNKLWETYQAGL